MLIRHPQLASWRTVFLAGLCFASALYIVVIHNEWNPLGSRSFQYSRYRSSSASSKGYTSQLIPFWKELAIALEAARPQCLAVQLSDDQREEMSADDKKWEPLKHKERPDRLNLTEVDESELIRAHRRMRLAARKLAPSLPVGHDTGIVTTGGIKLFPVLLISLRMLRRTGCTLPVQVFVGDQEEYEAVRPICEDVLPTLDAWCHVVSDIYSQAIATPPNHFQFKVLAILFSSFRHILFLDADAFPAHDPTPLLSAPPYTTHGLVTWPGIYANTASEHFYHITGATVPRVSRGSESGQILFNKEHHRESLLMMVYYNYYGPDYYYPLQAQGGPGQGDKETFSAGAVTVNAPGPFYGVKTSARILGNHVNGNFVFAGFAQADPVQDLEYDTPLAQHLLPSGRWQEHDSIGAQNAENAEPRSFFVHSVSTEAKIHPWKLFREGGLAWSPNKKWQRIWGQEKMMIEQFGYDVEKRLWDCIGEEVCRTDEALCAQVREYSSKVFGVALDST